jgi:hypothetical protein
MSGFHLLSVVSATTANINVNKKEGKILDISFFVSY